MGGRNRRERVAAVTAYLYILGILSPIAGFILTVFAGEAMSGIALISGFMLMGIFMALGKLVDNQGRMLEKLDALIKDRESVVK
jgi:hypothetical protein